MESASVLLEPEPGRGMEAMNLSGYLSEEWPSVKSEHWEAFDFEVFNIAEVHSHVSQYGTWVTATCILYVAAVFGGQAYMKNRPAYKLKSTLAVWNVFLAVFSLVTFLRCWPEFWFTLKDGGFYYTVCWWKVHSFPSAFWGMLFMFSKVVEFGDTAFIILRKQKLIFLHWYHHAVTLYLGFRMYEVYDPAIKIPVITNSFIHFLMYSYYGLKALKFHVPEPVARCITTLQITQMAMGVGVNVYSLFLLERGVPCGRTRSTSYLSIAAAAIFFLLFSSFYVKRYLKVEGKAKAKLQ